MKGWNPFGKIDMEIGSFLKASPFNKEYQYYDKSDDFEESYNSILKEYEPYTETKDLEEKWQE